MKVNVELKDLNLNEAQKDLFKKLQKEIKRLERVIDRKDLQINVLRGKEYQYDEAIQTMERARNTFKEIFDLYEEPEYTLVRG